MKVLLIFSSSELGGAERSLSRMAFASREVNYTLATLDGEGPWCDWVRSMHHQPIILGDTDRRRKFGMINSLRRLVQHIRKNPVDIIYICGVRASLFVRLIRIFLFRNIRLVHGVRWNPNSNSKLDRLLRFVERHLKFLVDAWITNADVSMRTLEGRCGISPGRIFVIHNGLEFLPDVSCPPAERPKEVLTVANLRTRKGHEEYLWSVQKVLDIVPDARFVFVGRDEMAGKIQREIEVAGLSSYVRYDGFQENISEYFQRSRVFVLPSLWNEGCPTAILEAMSFAVPCVAFAIDGIPELINNGEQGILLQSGDYSGLALAIADLLRDDSKANRFGVSGRKRVDSNFKLKHTVALHESAFYTILRGHNQ